MLYYSLLVLFSVFLHVGQSQETTRHQNVQVTSLTSTK